MWVSARYGPSKLRAGLADALLVYTGTEHNGLIRALRGTPPLDGWDVAEALAVLNSLCANGVTVAIDVSGLVCEAAP